MCDAVNVLFILLPYSRRDEVQLEEYYLVRKNNFTYIRVEMSGKTSTFSPSSVFHLHHGTLLDGLKLSRKLIALTFEEVA